MRQETSKYSRGTNSCRERPYKIQPHDTSRITRHASTSMTESHPKSERNPEGHAILTPSLRDAMRRRPRPRACGARLNDASHHVPQYSNQDSQFGLFLSLKLIHPYFNVTSKRNEQTLQSAHHPVMGRRTAPADPPPHLHTVTDLQPLDRALHPQRRGATCRRRSSRVCANAATCQPRRRVQDRCPGTRRWYSRVGARVRADFEARWEDVTLRLHRTP